MLRLQPSTSETDYNINITKTQAVFDQQFTKPSASQAIESCLERKHFDNFYLRKPDWANFVGLQR